ncbi:hypothetical protein [Lacinutrix chionoecetis]
MGGEGAMMHANQSLKANRKLVGKRKEKRFSFVHTSTEKTEYDLPQSTPETLKIIRQNMKRENRSNRIKRFVILILTVTILLAILTYFL